MNKEQVIWDITLFIFGCLLGANSVNFYNYKVENIKHYDCETKTIVVQKKFRQKNTPFIQTPVGVFKVSPFQFTHIHEGKSYRINLKTNGEADILDGPSGPASPGH